MLCDNEIIPDMQYLLFKTNNMCGCDKIIKPIARVRSA